MNNSFGCWLKSSSQEVISCRPTPSQSFVERVAGDQALCRYSRPSLDNSLSLWLAIGQLMLEGRHQIFQKWMETAGPYIAGGGGGGGSTQAAAPARKTKNFFLT